MSVINPKLIATDEYSRHALLLIWKCLVAEDFETLQKFSNTKLIPHIEFLVKQFTDEKTIPEFGERVEKAKLEGLDELP